MPDTETMNTRRWREEQKKRQPAKPQTVSATTPMDPIGPPSATPYADANEAARRNGPTYPRGMTNDDVMAIAGRPPVNATGPYQPEITNNDVLAAAKAPTPQYPLGVAAGATDGYQPVTMAQAYKNVNLDREEVMRRLWQSKYGPRELRNPGAVGGLIEQRRDLERTSNTLRPAAVEPGPVMTPDQERLSRQRIADQMIQANAQMTQDVLARRGEAPRVGPPVTNADFERINMMRRMGVSEGQMGDLEKLTGRPSPRLIGPPSLNDVVYANPDTLARPRTAAEYSAEVANRNAAFEQANAPDGPAAQELARYNRARQASMESEALAREVAMNRLKTQAVMTDPELAREQMTANIEGLRTGNQLRDVENQARLREARRQAGVSEVDSPDINMSIGQVVNSVASMNGSFVSSGPANAEMARVLSTNVDRIIEAYKAASPDGKRAMRVAVEGQLAGLPTSPGWKTMLGGGLATAGGLDTSVNLRFYSSLARLKSAMGI